MANHSLPTRFFSNRLPESACLLEGTRNGLAGASLAPSAMLLSGRKGSTSVLKTFPAEQRQEWQKPRLQSEPGPELAQSQPELYSRLAGCPQRDFRSCCID